MSTTVSLFICAKGLRVLDSQHCLCSTVYIGDSCLNTSGLQERSHQCADAGRSTRCQGGLHAAARAALLLFNTSMQLVRVPNSEIAPKRACQPSRQLKLQAEAYTGWPQAASTKGAGRRAPDATHTAASARRGYTRLHSCTIPKRGTPCRISHRKCEGSSYMARCTLPHLAATSSTCTHAGMHTPQRWGWRQAHSAHSRAG